MRTVACLRTLAVGLASAQRTPPVFPLQWSHFWGNPGPCTTDTFKKKVHGRRDYLHCQHHEGGQRRRRDFAFDAVNNMTAYRLPRLRHAGTLATILACS